MLFVLFIVWVAAELFVIVRVAEAIGVLLTIVLLIAAWPFGAWAMRSEGRVVWRQFNAALAEGRPPGREVAEGALVALGGVLLMVPGFISDVLGLLLLFPPTRMLVRTGLVRRIHHRLAAQASKFASGAGPGSRPAAGSRAGWGPSAGSRAGSGPSAGSRAGSGPARSPGPSPADVEGTATEVDPPQLRP